MLTKDRSLYGRLLAPKYQYMTQNKTQSNWRDALSHARDILNIYHPTRCFRRFGRWTHATTFQKTSNLYLIWKQIIGSLFHFEAAVSLMHLALLKAKEKRCDTWQGFLILSVTWSIIVPCFTFSLFFSRSFLIFYGNYGSDIELQHSEKNISVTLQSFSFHCAFLLAIL